MAEYNIKLGPDGEPEPEGNEAQRAAGRAVAATFTKSLKGIDVKNLDEIKEEVKKAEVKSVPQAKPVDKDSAEAVKQEQANKVYKESVKPGYTQSTATAPTPKNEPNKIGVPNVEVKAEGTVTPPSE